MDKERLRKITQDLSYAAEEAASVSIHLYEEDILEALQGYDERDRYKPLTEWVNDRRLLGIEPTAADILDWADEHS